MVNLEMLGQLLDKCGQIEQKRWQKLEPKSLEIVGTLEADKIHKLNFTS